MNDFGEGKWVVARKQHRCEACYGPIYVKERHYHFCGMWDDSWQNWRMHEECFNVYDDEGEYEFMPGSFDVPDRLKYLYAN